MIKRLVDRVEQHYISKKHPMYNTIDELSYYSKNLYNYANYIIRQEFINNNRYIGYFEMCSICKDAEPYMSIGSNVGQQTLRLLNENWKSFFKAIQDWKQNSSKYLGRPKLPKYKDINGRYLWCLDSNKIKIKNGFVYFSWKKIKTFNNVFLSKIPNGSKILQCRFIPCGLGYMMEVVYQIEVPEVPIESNNIVAIDLGVDNFVTMTNNIGLQPIIIKGGVIKSINQYYNKNLAKIQLELRLINNKFSSHKLDRLAYKREQKLKYEMHLISKRVIEYCLRNNIDTLVCGLNKEWKQNSKMSHKVNQKFIYIPFNSFVNMLAYKCENVGIKFILTEESYTSGTSFLDNEEPCKENYDKSRRKYRGLFISNTGKAINADVNGSYQIMKKVFPNAFANGIEGAGLHPTLMKIA